MNTFRVLVFGVGYAGGVLFFASVGGGQREEADIQLRRIDAAGAGEESGIRPRVEYPGVHLRDDSGIHDGHRRHSAALPATRVWDPPRHHNLPHLTMVRNDVLRDLSGVPSGVAEEHQLSAVHLAARLPLHLLPRHHGLHALPAIPPLS